ncbi:MAG: hypothetical protein ACHQUC_03965 [Chlamydiales bacterium]
MYSSDSSLNSPLFLLISNSLACLKRIVGDFFHPAYLAAGDHAYPVPYEKKNKICMIVSDRMAKLRRDMFDWYEKNEGVRPASLSLARGDHTLLLGNDTPTSRLAGLTPLFGKPYEHICYSFSRGL